MKYHCINESCENYNQQKEIIKVSYSFVGGKLITKDLICPVCGLNMEEVDKEPLDLQSISIGTFRSMNREQRKEMLKKRSHKDFKKNVKPYADHLEATQKQQFNELRNRKK